MFLDKVDTIAGLSSKGFVDQSVLSSHFNNPQSLALFQNDKSQRSLYVADTVSIHKVLLIVWVLFKKVKIINFLRASNESQ